MDVHEWLEGLGLGEYVEAFVDNHIDEQVLPDLTADDLKDLGVRSVGHRRRLLSEIAKLAPTDAANDGPAHPEIEPAVAMIGADAERRQLTVLFCDLVGSTELSGRLDPEDMREVLTKFQDMVAGIISRHDGFVANYLGDGVLAYFGWPKAHEDQAAQAVRAGLAASHAVRSIAATDGEALAVRIGIATGLVVVGDLAGETARQADAVVGNTPNLASRLQSVAEPSQVLIDVTTRQLLSAGFVLQRIASQSFKGFSEPVAAWWVTGEADVVGRFDAAHSRTVVPLVAREHELELLMARWRVAAGAEGQVVLLSGEAGIGKSRLVAALVERMADADHYSHTFQCSPRHQNTAFYPVIRHIEHSAGFLDSDSNDIRLDKLQALLALDEATEPVVMPHIAAHCGLDYEIRFGQSSLSPERRRQRFVSLLVKGVVELARKKPVFLLLEDAHWIDPSSNELLADVVSHIVDLSVFLLVTHRPSWVPPWSAQAHVTSLSLNRLSRSATTELVRKIAGFEIDEAAITNIAERSDGIPLFAEELTIALLEQNATADTAEVPITLQASLSARLDRLGPQVKDVAQRAAVLGREFSFRHLVSIVEQTETELSVALAALVQSELLFPTRSSPNQTYAFKHALVRDAAYDSVTKSHRVVLHERAAQALQTPDPDEVGAPALIAHHYTMAQRFDEALPYWCRAARQALESSHYHETIAYVRDGLTAAEQADDVAAITSAQRDLYLCRGPAYAAVKGFAAPELLDAYSKARVLANETGSKHQQFMATWGLWHVNQMRHQFDAAESLVQEVLEVGEQQQEDGLRLQAHHAAWTTAFMRDLEACRRHAQRGVELYDLEQHRQLAFTFGGHDPGVCARIHLCWAPWYLGEVDQALVASDDAIELANRLGHEMSRVLAAYYRAELHAFRREPSSAYVTAQHLIEFCDQSGISPQYHAAGRIIQGWAIAQCKDAVEGCKTVEEGLTAFLDIGARFRLPHYQSLYAESLCLANSTDTAIETLNSAQTAIDKSHEMIWQAEVDRILGVVKSLQRRDFDEVEPHFQAAITIARQQKARTLELRSATDLAKHLSNIGRDAEARDLLLPIYKVFTEGFDTHDLRQAKTVLDELG